MYVFRNAFKCERIVYFRREIRNHRKQFLCTMLAAIKVGKSTFRNILPYRKTSREGANRPTDDGAAQAQLLKISRSMKLGHTPSATPVTRRSKLAQIRTSETRKVSLAKAHGENVAEGRTGRER